MQDVDKIRPTAWSTIVGSAGGAVFPDKRGQFRFPGLESFIPRKDDQIWREWEGDYQGLSWHVYFSTPASARIDRACVDVVFWFLDRASETTWRETINESPVNVAPTTAIDTTQPQAQSAEEAPNHKGKFTLSRFSQ